LPPLENRDVMVAVCERRANCSDGLWPPRAPNPEQGI
jgi:hypothetical protein